MCYAALSSRYGIIHQVTVTTSRMPAAILSIPKVLLLAHVIDAYAVRLLCGLLPEHALPQAVTEELVCDIGEDTRLCKAIGKTCLFRQLSTNLPTWRHGLVLCWPFLPVRCLSQDLGLRVLPLFACPFDR